MIRSEDVDHQALADEPVTDATGVDAFKLQSHFGQCRCETDGSSRRDPDVNEGVGVVCLPPRELTVLHPVKEHHLAANEHPLAGEPLGKQAEEWPEVPVDLIAIDCGRSMAGNGSGTAEQLVSDAASPNVAAVFEQVDGSNFGPRHAFPVSEGPRAPHNPGDQVGLGGTLVGHVPLNESINDVTGDVGVDWTAVAELAAGPRPAHDDAILGEEVVDHAGMHVPGTPVGAPTELGCQLDDLPVGEHVMKSTDLGRYKPGDVTAGGEGQQSPCPSRRPWPSGAALLVGEAVDAVRVDQPPTGDLACIESSVSDELTDAFE
ncbi:MAG: hypothetical protein QOG43_1404 [Actinomycetota bacterium]|nr:hypothetical protein [Actinomycetota bacterium]